MLHVPTLLADPPAGDATDRAYFALKRRIIALEPAPGAHVTKAGLSSLIGFGEMPIRGALARLAQDGMVEARPRSGYRVLPVTMRSTRDVFALRRALEVESAGLCAELGLTEEVAQRMEDLIAVSRPHQHDSAESFIRAGFEFHALIADGGRSHRIARATARVFDDLERVLRVVLGISPDCLAGAAEAAGMLAAIRRGDPDEARAAMRQHLTASEQAVLATLMTSRSVTDINISLAAT